MSISSRTPEGFPARCPFCGQESVVEPSEHLGDSVCPRCGQLLWTSWERRYLDRWCQQHGIDVRQVTLLTPLSALGFDSLELVQVVMEVEEELAVAPARHQTFDLPGLVSQATTVGDLLQLLARYRRR